MNEKKLETKEELKSIIDAAFYDFDDYVTDCHESGIDVTEDVEDFVADAIIKAGYMKQSEWISVEDRLPEMYEDVLCYADGHSFYVDFICSDGKWCDDESYTNRVTHWMPLPEPPKMKGGVE